MFSSCETSLQPGASSSLGRPRFSLPAASNRLLNQLQLAENFKRNLGESDSRNVQQPERAVQYIKPSDSRGYRVWQRVDYGPGYQDPTENGKSSCSKLDAHSKNPTILYEDQRSHTYNSRMPQKSERNLAGLSIVHITTYVCIYVNEQINFQ